MKYMKDTISDFLKVKINNKRHVFRIIGAFVFLFVGKSVFSAPSVEKLKLRHWLSVIKSGERMLIRFNNDPCTYQPRVQVKLKHVFSVVMTISI